MCPSMKVVLSLSISDDACVQLSQEECVTKTEKGLHVKEALLTSQYKLLGTNNDQEFAVIPA